MKLCMLELMVLVLVLPAGAAFADVPSAAAGAVLSSCCECWCALACVTGKPPQKGGLVGRSEATGRGVQYIIREFFRHKDDYQPVGLKDGLAGKNIAIQGFGNVGFHAAKFLQEEDDCKIICIMEHNGALLNPKGINVQAAKNFYMQKGTFDGCSDNLN